MKKRIIPLLFCVFLVLSGCGKDLISLTSFASLAGPDNAPKPARESRAQSASEPGTPTPVNTALGFVLKESEIQADLPRIPLQIDQYTLAGERIITGRSSQILDFDNIEIQYDFASDDPPVAVVQKDGKYGIINANYEYIIPTEYDRLVPVCDRENGPGGLHAFYGYRGGAWRCIDLDAMKIIDIDYITEETGEPYFSYEDFSVLFMGYLHVVDYSGTLPLANISWVIPAFDGRVLETISTHRGAMGQAPVFISGTSDISLHFGGQTMTAQDDELFAFTTADVADSLVPYPFCAAMTDEKTLTWISGRYTNTTNFETIQKSKNEQVTSFLTFPDGPVDYTSARHVLVRGDGTEIYSAPYRSYSLMMHSPYSSLGEIVPEKIIAFFGRMGGEDFVLKYSNMPTENPWQSYCVLD